MPGLLASALLVAASLLAPVAADAQAVIQLGSGFALPAAVAVDSSGNVFVADASRNEVMEIPAGGGPPVQIGADEGNFNQPQGLAVDAAGNVYVADTDNGAIKKITAADGYFTVKTLVPNGTLSNPFGLAVDADGNIFVANVVSPSAVLEVLAADNYATIVSLGSGFQAPVGIALDPAGNVFVSDPPDPDNAVKEIVASSGYQSVKGLTSGGVAVGQLAIDAQGNLYTGLPAFGLVIKITPEGGTPQQGGSFNFGDVFGIAVDQHGNIYAADEDASHIFEIEAATTTTLGVSPSPGALGATVTLTATITGSAGSPSGTVTFFDGGTALGQGTVSAGVASLTTQTLGVATHSLTARYGGDLTFAPSTSTAQTEIVNPAATTTTLISSADPSVPGQSVTFTASVSAVGGTVTFNDGATPLATVALAAGQAGFSTASLSTGDHSITASYNGDTDFAASSSGVLTQSVVLSASTTSITASVNPSTIGQSVTFGAVVSPTGSLPPGGLPTGMVFFFDGANPIGNTQLVSGQTALTTSLLTVGSHSITATYDGDLNYATSTSTMTQVVNPTATSTTLIVAPNPSAPGQTVTFTASVSGVGGTVTFNDGATPLDTVALTAGQASFSTVSLPTGTHSVTASYSGSGNFAASTSTAVTEVVTAATTTTLAAAPNPSAPGQTVTFTASVSGVGGTVTFKDGATPLGTFALTAGLASVSTATLSTGNHSITASYSGSATFAASTSSVLTQSVGLTASTTSIISSANPSTVGQPVTFTAFVSATGGTPTGSVTFKDGTTTLGSATLAAGVASFTTTALTAASHSITANYGGDTVFAISSSSVLTQTVNAAGSQASQATLASSADPSNVGQTVTFTAGVTGTGGNPTGTVTFRDGATLLGTGTIASGAASVSTSAFAVGSHAITASYSGDGTFGASASAPLIQVVEASSVAGQVYGYQSTLGVTGTAGADAAHFSLPVPGAVDPANSHLFVADTGNHRIQVLDTSTLAVVATIGVAGVPGTDDAHLDQPGGVGFDPTAGHLFVADTGNQRIQIFDAKSFAYLATLGATGTAGDDNGHFDLPGSAFIDPAAHLLYIADTGNHRVQIFDAGNFSLVATLGTSGISGSDTAHLNQPADAELDPSTSQILVADAGNQRVQVFDAASFAYVSTLGVAGTAGSDNSHFAQPMTASFDPATNLVLVADGGANDRVQVFDALTYNYVLTLGTVGSGGPANTQFAAPHGIATDPAHHRIFIGDGANERVQVFSVALVTTVAAVLPDSRSVQLGNPATIFASVLNAAPTALADCRIALPVTAPSGLSLSYQTTDPATNALTGTPNTPATIPGANGVQSFLISLQGTTAFSVTAMPLDFDCLGNAPAAVIPGVDTLDLTLSSTPIPDIIALAATPTNNGIVEVPAGGAAAFAVASTNVGAAAPITVSADTGTANLPLALTLCQSNPGTGQCLATPSASVPVNDAAGARPTFSVFLQASGPIALDPADSRIFVRFKDGSGGLHGSTSVAVEAE